MASVTPNMLRSHIIKSNVEQAITERNPSLTKHQRDLVMTMLTVTESKGDSSLAYNDEIDAITMLSVPTFDLGSDKETLNTCPACGVKAATISRVTIRRADEQDSTLLECSNCNSRRQIKKSFK